MLIDIYRACMRSSIDYGCIIYGAAAKTSLKKIDRLQYRALRVCIGAIKSTPTNAILIETGETPLKLRREKLALAYWIRLKGSGKENPTKEIIQDCWEYYKYQGRGFGWTRRMEEVGIKTSIYIRNSYNISIHSRNCGSHHCITMGGRG